MCSCSIRKHFLQLHGGLESCELSQKKLQRYSECSRGMHGNFRLWLILWMLSTDGTDMHQTDRWKLDMRGDCRNHHMELELKRIWNAGQFIIPNMAQRTPQLAVAHIDNRYCKRNWACYSLSFAFCCTSCILLLTVFSFLFLVPNFNITNNDYVILSLSISQYHDHELTLGTASTQNQLSSGQSPVNVTITSKPLKQNFGSSYASLHIDQMPSASFHSSER